MPARNRERIERLARHYWEERGCPSGSPEVDWLRAERELEGTLHKIACKMGVVIGRAVAFLQSSARPNLRGSLALESFRPTLTSPNGFGDFGRHVKPQRG